jgi:hypothetical protein
MALLARLFLGMSRWASQSVSAARAGADNRHHPLLVALAAYQNHPRIAPHGGHGQFHQFGDTRMPVA